MGSLFLDVNLFECESESQVSGGMAMAFTMLCALGLWTRMYIILMSVLLSSRFKDECR